MENSTSELTYGDIRTAAERIVGQTQPVTMMPIHPSPHVWLALEFIQHTGSFKARGAANFTTAHVEAGTMPEAGVVIASGGNAGLACAWAARAAGVPATVFVPESAPRIKVERLRAYGADVLLVGREYADALAASKRFAQDRGALLSHAYDNPLIAAGAGTLVPEMLAGVSGQLDTIVVAVGGGGLFSGVATAAEEHGIRTVAVEPEHCRALNAALEAGRVVDVPVDSVAADSLGARRVSETALATARRTGAFSVLVSDQAIIESRQALWDNFRVVVEHAAATALAALSTGAYTPALGEKVAVILCGANTDPAGLVI